MSSMGIVVLLLFSVNLLPPDYSNDTLPPIPHEALPPIPTETLPPIPGECLPL